MSTGTMTEEKIYTVKEIAAILRINPRTVRRMIALGELEAIKIRDEFRIRQSALDAVLQKKPEHGESQ
jgi:excisionase family DNA binding protein